MKKRIIPLSYTDRIGGIFLLRIIVELEERDYRL